MSGILAGLALCFVAIFLGGGWLTRTGDRISDASGLDHHVMGMLFLAAVTSLPELSAGLSAAGWSASPDIAYGEVLGSCVFNLAILGMADLLSRRPVVASRAPGVMLNGGTGVILLALAALALRLPGPARVVALAADGAILAVYFLGLEGARRVEATEPAAAGSGRRQDLPRLWLAFGAASLLVIGPGLWLPHLAADLAREAGLTQSLVGTFLVGAFTSAPEMIVTYHCVIRGWGAMALGNLLGSNLFNIAILAPMDWIYPGGALYRAAGEEHIVTALSALIMTGMVIFAGVWRSRARKPPRLRAEGPLLLTVYVLVFLYLFGPGGGG